MFGADDADRGTDLEDRADAVGADRALVEGEAEREVDAVEDATDRRRTVPAVDDPGGGVGEGDGDGDVGHVVGEAVDDRACAAGQPGVEVDVGVERDLVAVGVDSCRTAARPRRRDHVIDSRRALRTELEKVGPGRRDAKLLVTLLAHLSMTSCAHADVIRDTAIIPLHGPGDQHRTGVGTVPFWDTATS